jgi:NAD(P)-dependent dehydrogenase (short-subunit alcohol dehydrogenase family)
MRGGFSAGRTPAGRADLGAIARPRLTDPFGTLHDAVQTGFADVPWPPQYLPGRVQLERNLARAGRGIGILIDNAGIAKSAMLAATDDELWNELVAANLTGPFLCTRAAPSALLEAGAGRVDNVASTAALVGYPHVAAYCAAKHGAVPD